MLLIRKTTRIPQFEVYLQRPLLSAIQHRNNLQRKEKAIALKRMFVSGHQRPNTAILSLTFELRMKTKSNGDMG